MVSFLLLADVRAPVRLPGNNSGANDLGQSGPVPDDQRVKTLFLAHAVTVFTQFLPPMALAVLSLAAGSSCQIPSAMNRYS